MTYFVGTVEINGDAPMSAFRRIRYVMRNMLRNIGGFAAPVSMRQWALPHQILTDHDIRGTSPARILGEAFIIHELPKLTTPRHLRVLDIGCGSGRMSDLLAKAGYGGHYTGVDVQDRFDSAKWQGGAFTVDFVKGDAHELDLESGFDLIISNSALEHIPDDGKLIARLQALLAQHGLQVHLVPSTWALFLYLWHGYRQYGRGAIAARFTGPNTQVYKLGGAICFLTHFTFITVPEILLRISLRKKFPALYAALLYGALRMDCLLPFMPSGYAIVSQTEGGPRG